MVFLVVSEHYEDLKQPLKIMDKLLLRAFFDISVYGSYAVLLIVHLGFQI